MSGLIYTYALMKSLYDQGQDYLDAFWPFAIKTMPQEGFVSAQSVRTSLRERFGLDMPLDVLTTVLTRAKRKDYARQRSGRYGLTAKGRHYAASLETQTEVESRIAELLEDMLLYFSERELSVDRSGVGELLLPFLRANIAPLVEFLDPAAASGGLSIGRAGKAEKALVEYIETAELEKPDHYRTLQDMVLGSLISAILYSREPSDIVEIGRRFAHCEVFLDTNFVFSLLQLHEPEVNQAAAELLRMLKKFGFRVKVFDFTVDELCSVIGGYVTDGYRYPASIAVDTIYSTLARKGWTATDAKIFVTDVDRIVAAEGLTIDRRHRVDLRYYEPGDEELRARMAGYKPFQGRYGQNHDLAAVEQIRKLRGKVVRRIEYAGACFLTSDVRLSRFNLVDMGHRDNGTVCEVILDRLLTSMLWLKDPSTQPSLKAIIGTYSRDLFVDRQVWERFYAVLRDLRKQEAVDDEHVSMLFYHKYIEEVLLGFDDKDLEQITPQFVLKEIENASCISAQKIGKEIEEKFLARLTEEVSKAEQIRDQEWLERLEALRSRISLGAQKSARRMMLAGRIVLAVLLVLPAAFCLVTGRLAAFNTIGSGLSILLVVLALVAGSIKPAWAWLEERLFNALYARRIDSAGLGILERGSRAGGQSQTESR